MRDNQEELFPMVDENGQVHVPAINDATRPEFGTAALNAVKQWSFAPPLHRGTPTRVLAIQEFNFSPSKGQPDAKPSR